MTTAQEARAVARTLANLLADMDDVGSTDHKTNQARIMAGMLYALVKAITEEEE